MRGVEPLPIIDPIRPVLQKQVPLGPDWVYEPKIDGFRGTLYVENRGGVFRSKTKKHMRRFDSLANQLAKHLGASSAVLDGEIIATRRRKVDFRALMFRKGAIGYVAFDLLWLNGRDLRDEPYARRKTLLRRLLARQKVIGCVDEHTSPELFDAAVRLDLEGIVAKRIDDPYLETTRWVKVKHRGYSQMQDRSELFGKAR